MKKNIIVKLSTCLLFLFFFVNSSSSQVAVFNPAEFEKSEGVIMTWAYNPGFDTVIANISEVAQQAAKVWIAYNPDNSNTDTTSIRIFLMSMGVVDSNLFFIPAFNETSWTRDYGPNVLYGNFGQGNERYILDMGYGAYNRPLDDSFPVQIADLWGWTKLDLSLELEGGNLQFDGLTRGFASTRVQEQNPDISAQMLRNILIDKFNLMDFTFLQSLGNSGGGEWQHVDMFMKVLDYETLLVSSYPDSLPYHSILENNMMILEGLSNHFNKPYRILRIPAPPKADGTFATTQNDEMRSYTNSLILNNTVIVPSFGLDQYDQQAAQIYSEALPGYKIIMIDSRYISQLGGAIRRITKEIPNPAFMRIIHKKVIGRQEYSPEMYLYSNCESNSGIQGMWLYYKVNNQEQYSRVPVYMACPQNIGIIEGLEPGDKVCYYLEGVSASGETMTYPGGAPAAGFTFWYDAAVGMDDPKVSDNNLRIVSINNSGSFLINGARLPKTGLLTVFNSSGSLIYQTQINKGDVIHSGLKSGIYIIQYSDSNNFYSSKLLIMN